VLNWGGFTQLGLLVGACDTEEDYVTICVFEIIASFGSPHMTELALFSFYFSPVLSWKIHLVLYLVCVSFC
jgi:hypothetical protein